jgi:DNA-binding LytR/AlgR family response regulator
VNGDFSFAYFTLTVYLPTITILLPVIFVGRYLIARPVKDAPAAAPSVATITLSGSNKLDILKLPLADLVALEAANNYVTVHYLLAGEMQKKLLRSSLRKMHETVPEMVQVHRSYLVNAQHFVEWEDAQTLVLTQMTAPVSQKYKADLLAMAAFATK